jgi:maltose O-acetyltransferase
MKKFLKNIGPLYLTVQIVKRYGVVLKVRRKFRGSSIDPSVKIITAQTLTLGKHVEIQHNVTLHCGGLDWCNNTGSITIGDHSVLSNDVVIWGCGANVVIGKNFDCAPGVKIFASRTDYEHINERKHIFKDIIIGDNVICYANVVIGPGVTIGNNAVIGANSVVLNDIPPDVVVAGSPAKEIKKRNQAGQFK